MDVIDKDESYVYLRTTRTQECESCAMKGGCTLLGGANELNLKAKNIEKVDVKKGDKVVVELPEVPVVKLSFLVLWDSFNSFLVYSFHSLYFGLFRYLLFLGWHFRIGNYLFFNSSVR